MADIATQHRTLLDHVLPAISRVYWSEWARSWTLGTATADALSFLVIDPENHVVERSWPAELLVDGKVVLYGTIALLHAFVEEYLRAEAMDLEAALACSVPQGRVRTLLVTGSSVSIVAVAPLPPVAAGAA
jgi:hypothetical protein